MICHKQKSTVFCSKNNGIIHDTSLLKSNFITETANQPIISSNNFFLLKSKYHINERRFTGDNLVYVEPFSLSCQRDKGKECLNQASHTL